MKDLRLIQNGKGFCVFMDSSTVTFIPLSDVHELHFHLKMSTSRTFSPVMQPKFSSAQKMGIFRKRDTRGAESAVKDEVWKGRLPWSLAILSEDSA